MVVPTVVPTVDPTVVPMVVPMKLVGVNEDEDDDNQARSSSFSSPSSSIAVLAQAIFARACFFTPVTHQFARPHTAWRAQVRINSHQFARQALPAA